MWRDAREDEWAAFETRYTRKGIGGSNPSPAERSEKGSDQTALVARGI